MRALLLLLLLGQLAEASTRESQRQRLESSRRGIQEKPSEDSPLAVASNTDEGMGLEPIDYLRRFGYLTNLDEVLSERTTKRAIEAFQSFVGIAQSGDLDYATTRQMQIARCANKDILLTDAKTDEDAEDEANKTSTYLNRWHMTSGQLTYKLANYPSNLAKRRPEVDKVFELAFNAWASVVPIKFVSLTNSDESNKANLEIKFVKDEHQGCELGPLPKPTKEATYLGHSYGPQPNEPDKQQIGAPEGTLAGDIHLNDYILWSLDNGSGQTVNNHRNLLASAIHQIGHSLGLDHSRLLGSKMFPIENNRIKLNESDKMAIREIYNPAKEQLENFIQLERRRLPDRLLDWYDADSSLVSSLNDCASFSYSRRINLTVWDRQRQICSAKITSSSIEPGSALTMYTGAGKPLDHYDTGGYDQDVSELESDVAGWLASQQCDLILKMENWPQQAGNKLQRTTYRCKMMREDDCCVMLLRVGEPKAAQKLLAKPLTAS